MGRHAAGRALLVVAIVALSLGAPPAGASVTIALDVAEIRVVDGFGHNCDAPAAEVACIGEYDVGRPEDPGDDSVNLAVGRVSVVLGLRPGRIPGIGGTVQPLLPDEGVWISLHRRGVDSPVFPAYMAARNHSGALPTDPWIGMDYNEERSRSWMPWVQPSRAHEGVKRWEQDVNWSDGRGTADYRHVYVPSEFAYGDTDGIAASILPPLCGYTWNFSSSVCSRLDYEEIDRTYQAATPRIETGASFEDVHVDPDLEQGENPSSSSQGVVQGSASEPDDAAPVHERLAFTPALPSVPLSPIDSPGTATAADSDLRWTANPEAATRGARAPERSVHAPTSMLLVTTFAGAALAVWGALALYQRLSRSGVLDQGTRKLILDAVRQSPGIHPTGLARALGLHLSTIEYHARVLQRARVLVIDRPPGAREHHFFLAGADPSLRASADRERALRHPIAAAIVAALGTRRSVARSEIHTLIKAPPSTVNWHLRRLIEAGIAEAPRKGKLQVAGAPGEPQALPPMAPAAGS